MNDIIKKPSAWIPLGLSALQLLAILVVITNFGIPEPDPSADEGVGARLFQLWLTLEVIMIGFFAAKWLPREPRQALVILVIQILAVLVTCFPVFYLKL